MTAPNYQNAQRVLQALVQGVDPETGHELPNDTALNRPTIIRALLAAVGALEIMQLRAQRRAQLPESVGKPWDAAEQKRLVKEYQQAIPIPDIADNHGRTVRAIEARLQRLGLLKPEDRTTRNNFMGEGDVIKETGEGEHEQL